MRDDFLTLKQVHAMRRRRLLDSPVPSQEPCHCDLHKRKPRTGKAILYLLIGLLVLISCRKAFGYSDEQIANAIKKAEGTWTYGIKSVSCTTEADCRRVCLRTIKNNRVRYSKDARRRTETYLAYLSRVYAPVGASNDPTGLNRNWLKNVKYFLAKEIQ